MVPTCIADLIPPLVSEILGYPLRNDNTFSPPFTQTNVSSRSCIPSGIKMWNNLDEALKSKPTLSSFKHTLQTTKIQVPSFHIWKKTSAVLHARVINNCSNLNNNLFNNHLREAPFVVGEMKQKMVNTTSFIATITEMSITNSLKDFSTTYHKYNIKR